MNSSTSPYFFKYGFCISIIIAQKVLVLYSHLLYLLRMRDGAKIRLGLTYDDVLLVPKYCDIGSRKEIDVGSKLSKNISLNIPIVSANMDTVTEARMAIAMASRGGIG